MAVEGELVPGEGRSWSGIGACLALRSPGQVSVLNDQGSAAPLQVTKDRYLSARGGIGSRLQRRSVPSCASWRAGGAGVSLVSLVSLSSPRP
jgi:hypothetical protein